MQIAAKVAEYFGTSPDVSESAREEHPVIVGYYHPHRGWRAANGRPATVAQVRAYQRTGCTSVEIYFNGRSADFTTDEIIRYAERPLLGGRLI